MSVIDDIKEKLDIVEVIAGYVQLQKAGRSFKALCPFHSEKSPSFFVSPQRQSWHCFGCGTGGDLFSFVMKKERLDFGETLRLLAEKAGIPLVQKLETKDKEVQNLYEINEAAAQYYHHLLLNTPAGERAREYLKGRGLARETIEDFQLGFSLDSWDALQKYLVGRGHEELEKAGLVVKGEGGTYDLFHGRLIFPIRNTRGRVLGFGGRALDNSSPKYLNSPQTPVFNKSEVLYGIDRSAAAIRGQNLVVVVEGYMDVLTAHQYGMRNVVASMGTALTERQITILKRLTNNLVLALDADAAGDEATLRGIEVCRQTMERKLRPEGMELGGKSYLDAEIRIAPLPQGKDADDMIRENPEEWQRAVDQALPLSDYRFQVATSRLDLTKPKDKEAAIQQLLPYISEMKSDVQQVIYLKKLSQLVGVEERHLLKEAAKLHLTAAEKSKRMSLSQPSSDRPRDLEEYCLCLLLRHPELREKSGGLSPEHFNRIENRQIFTAWRDSPESLWERVDQSLHEHLNSLMTRTLPPASESERESEFGKCVRRLQEERLKKAQEELTEMFDDGSLESAVAQQKIKEVDEALREVFTQGERKAGARGSNG